MESTETTTEETERPQEAAEPGRDMHVFVAEWTPAGYARVAHWRMLHPPVEMPMPGADVALGAAVIGRLCKHLRGGEGGGA